MNSQEVKNALRNAIFKCNGNIRELSRKTGVAYSILHRLINGRTDIERVPFGTLSRLFPEMKITFFAEDYPVADCVVVSGSNSGAIANGRQSSAVVNNDGGIMTNIDESTRILLSYWKDLPNSRRFEIIAKLAEIKEQK